MPKAGQPVVAACLEAIGLSWAASKVTRATSSPPSPGGHRATGSPWADSAAPGHHTGAPRVCPCAPGTWCRCGQGESQRLDRWAPLLTPAPQPGFPQHPILACPVTLPPPLPVLQEAVSTRDLELVQLVLRYRDYQRVVKRLAGIPVLLEKLRKVRASLSASSLWPSHPVCSADLATLLVTLQAQDFYVEMKWEFTSWGKRGRCGHLWTSGLLHLLLPCLEHSSHSSYCGSSSFSFQLHATS